MLHKQLAAYLAQVEPAITQSPDGYVERYEEEILTSDRVNLRLRIRFTSGYLLEVSEAVVVAAGDVLQTLGYRYHLLKGGLKGQRFYRGGCQPARTHKRRAGTI